jgi:hypothetical protein
MKNVVWRGNKEISVVKKESLVVMEHHVNQQIEVLKEQATVLIKQSEKIKERVEIAYLVASADYGFEPVLLKHYYLYKNKDKLILTLIGPQEWDSPYEEYVATVRKLGDSTWETC